MLGGVPGAAGVPLVAFAIVSGPSGSASEQALLIAAIVLLLGTALFGFGQALDRLLDDGPDDTV